MVGWFVAGWRTTGKAASPTGPERIALKHAAILVTRAADEMTDQQQPLLNVYRHSASGRDRVAPGRPWFSLRPPSGESIQMRRWIEGAQPYGFGPVRLSQPASKTYWDPWSVPCRHNKSAPGVSLQLFVR